jgi:hypothetical protein
LRRGHHARRDFPKRRGFFFQDEANEGWTFTKSFSNVFSTR